MNRSLISFVVFLILLAGLTAAFAPIGGSLDLSWNTIDGGGGTSTGGSLELTGTIGQHDAGGPMTGGSFELSGGFWPGGGGPESTPATLTDVSVFHGTLISGTLTDVLNSDNLYVRARSRLSFTSTKLQLVDIRVGAETDLLGGASLDITYEGRLNQPGGSAELRLRNWSNNSFQQIHTFPIGSTDNVQTVTVPATNRIRQTDGRIELSFRCTAVAVFSASFDSFTDWVEIAVE